MVCHFLPLDKTGIWLGFPGGATGKEPTCQCKRHKRCRFYPWVRKIPWRRAWQPTLVFLPGESHRQRRLASYNPWGCKESNTTERLGMHVSCINRSNQQKLTTLQYWDLQSTYLLTSSQMCFRAFCLEAVHNFPSSTLR